MLDVIVMIVFVFLCGVFVIVLSKGLMSECEDFEV